jgi:hypothetical protein
MLYYVLNVLFNIFIFGFGILFGIGLIIADAKKFGYMKTDPKDNKIKWVHKIKR